MKKGKPLRWSQYHRSIIVAVLLMLALTLPISKVLNMSNYQCPEEIPYFPNDEPVTYEEVAEILGFDHPQLLEGIASEAIFMDPVLITCTVLHEKIYVALLYPFDNYSWNLQIFDFETSHPILHSISVSGVDSPSYIGHGEPWGTLVTDHNQNGLPEVFLMFRMRCANCYDGSISILELMPNGNFQSLSLDGPEGLVYEALDWNSDGILDIRAMDEIFLGNLFSFHTEIYPEFVYSWNGSEYTLSYLQIMGISSENSAQLALVRLNAFNDVCQAIIDTSIESPYPTSELARTIFSVLYFYEHFLHEREQAWELIQRITDEAAACPFSPSLGQFFEDMSVIYTYFEGE
jgi:hypothetical protein